MIGNNNLSYLLPMVSFVVKCFNTLLVVWLTVYYAYYCTSASILSVFGMMQDSLESTTLLEVFSHPFFFDVSRWHESFSILKWMWLLSLICWIIGFYYIFWIVLLLSLLLMTRISILWCSLGRPFLISSSDIFYLVFWQVVLRLSGDD